MGIFNDKENLRRMRAGETRGPIVWFPNSRLAGVVDRLFFLVLMLAMVFGPPVLLILGALWLFGVL